MESALALSFTPAYSAIDEISRKRSNGGYTRHQQHD
jgi:hypothetical protein